MSLIRTLIPGALTQRTLAIALMSLAVAACADATTTDASTFEEPSLEAGKADGTDFDNWTYFRFVSNDMRRCMAPLCGGVYVARTNQSKIKCADGTWQKQCYVAQYDFSALAAGDAAAELQNEARSGLLVVRGELKQGFYPEFPDVPVLAVSEAWRAGGEAPANGIFYRAHDLGIMCITSPCVSVELTRLNRNADPISRVAGADLSRTGASDEAINAAWQAMHDDAIIIAGKLKKVTGQGGSAQTIVGAQFYTRVVADSAVGKACGGRAGACPGGLFCQFQDALCGAADGQGSCELKPAACTDEVQPVCGCDGVTYSNDCARKAAGAGFGTAGECKVALGCKIGGCGGEVCGSADMEDIATVCIARPTDRCYRELGVCEPQADGCGWTASPELQHCLDEAMNAPDQNP